MLQTEGAVQHFWCCRTGDKSLAGDAESELLPCLLMKIPESILPHQNKVPTHQCHALLATLLHKAQNKIPFVSFHVYFLGGNSVDLQ